MHWYVGYFGLSGFVGIFFDAERKNTGKTGLLQKKSLVIFTTRHISYSESVTLF